MQVIRARSPVIPKRMRMDEEQPGADLNKAAQAARRAASRVTAGVGIYNPTKDYSSERSTLCPSSESPLLLIHFPEIPLSDNETLHWMWGQ